ncbi:hypothetical protein BKA69DRAFT_1017806, partial [Paraphysoderma sedebokerense]
NLKSHIKTHTDPKNWVCEFCKKAFLRKADMLRHTRIHTKEKPYGCASCGVSFARQDGLVRH